VSPQFDNRTHACDAAARLGLVYQPRSVQQRLQVRDPSRDKPLLPLAS
jgi:hypothetical protein